jgi:hypothetical protein
MAVVISEGVEKKLLEKHDVTRREVIQCLENRLFTALKDNREEHDSDPPTLWIIAETNHGRRLKVVFIVKDGNAVIRTAYEPEPQAESIYRKKAKFL